MQNCQQWKQEKHLVKHKVDPNPVLNSAQNMKVVFFVIASSMTCPYVLLKCYRVFAMEAAKLLKQKAALSPAPPPVIDAKVEPADDPEDGELPEAPEEANKRRKHSPIVWSAMPKHSGKFGYICCARGLLSDLQVWKGQRAQEKHSPIVQCEVSNSCFCCAYRLLSTYIPKSVYKSEGRGI